MLSSHACLCALIAGASLVASEIVKVKPSPNDCELVVNDFTKKHDAYLNDLGREMRIANGMDMSVDEAEPHLILTPANKTSFFYTYLRKAGECFDASSFEYLSLEVKAEKDTSFMIGASTNPFYCNEQAENVMSYAELTLLTKDGSRSRTVADIPFSKLVGTFDKKNINAITIGSLSKPLEIYAIKLKGNCSKSLSETTIVAQKADHTLPEETKKECKYEIENFEDENEYDNFQKQSHGTDGTMKRETYSRKNGLSLISKNASSYWYTIMPKCTRLSQYDFLSFVATGPAGGDFTIRLETKVDCNAKESVDVVVKASAFGGELSGSQQQISIPLKDLPGFNKKVHTISAIVLGHLVNKGETHDNSTPAALNIKSISLRGVDCEKDEEVVKPEPESGKDSHGDSNHDGTIGDNDPISSSLTASVSLATIAFIALVLNL